MGAFNDRTCAACGKRYGWPGELRDCPACPRCGIRPNIGELEEVEKELEKARREILGDDEVQEDLP